MTAPITSRTRRLSRDLLIFTTVLDRCIIPWLISPRVRGTCTGGTLSGHVSSLAQTSQLSIAFLGCVIATSGPGNLTERPHCRRTWTVRLYSPGDTNVHPHLTCFLGPTESTSQRASHSLHLFSHSSLQWATPSPPRNSHFPWEIWTPSNT